ncbi:MAG TPA: xanthine dehydrogenase family protein subunit M [Mycobacteriales bacterium]|jgi:carbon-monoxide dehydrogenase medium subunit|nr:xanthine dehydrogenase family protein subunit M [Mycobacteriales bacterium]
MYPPKFDYAAPRSLDEALRLLADHGEDAKVLAGGQSLIPMMKLRLASPAMLVDINRLPGLGEIEEADGYLTLGALVRHNDVGGSALVARRNPTMAAAAPWIADPIVRNRGTVCGALAHADPLGDWASVMLACDAEIVATSASGRRTIPMGEFITDVFTTALRDDELVTEVRVPVPSVRTGGDYQTLERKVGDYATAAVATRLDLDGDGRIAAAGIGLTSVCSVNTKVTEAEALLTGQQPSAELFAEAADIAARTATPQDDVRGPAEYKRDLVRVFTRRGLARSLELALAG